MAAACVRVAELLRGRAHGGVSAEHVALAVYALEVEAIEAALESIGTG